MCVGLPARVIHVAEGGADVDVGGGRIQRASIVTADRIYKGDYVLLYANLIMEKIDRRSALETLGYMKEMAALAAEDDCVHGNKARTEFIKRASQLTRGVH